MINVISWRALYDLLQLDMQLTGFNLSLSLKDAVIKLSDWSFSGDEIILEQTIASAATDYAHSQGLLVHWFDVTLHYTATKVSFRK